MLACLLDEIGSKEQYNDSQAKEEEEKKRRRKKKKSKSYGGMMQLVSTTMGKHDRQRITCFFLSVVMATNSLPRRSLFKGGASIGAVRELEGLTEMKKVPDRSKLCKNMHRVYNRMYAYVIP